MPHVKAGQNFFKQNAQVNMGIFYDNWKVSLKELILQSFINTLSLLLELVKFCARFVQTNNKITRTTSN